VWEIAFVNPQVEQTLQNVFAYVIPEAGLVGLACVLFMLSTLRASRTLAGVLSLVGLVAAGYLLRTFPGTAPELLTVSAVLTDPLSLFVRYAALATGFVLVLVCWNDVGNKTAADYFACLMIITAGFSLIGSANDLIVVFLALEMISIPTYIMLWLPKPKDYAAQESSVKYFMLSIVSSAMLLFGFSYLYGMTGTTNIAAIVEILPSVVSGDGATMFAVANVMVLAGIGFRITAFPFHFYAPDVYQGAPTGTTAMLSFVPKLAGFIVLLRLFAQPREMLYANTPLMNQTLMLFWILATVSMVAGNVLAVMQTNIRRMLAYSGVANAGYMLIGMAVMPSIGAMVGDVPAGLRTIAPGGEAMLFYLIAYGAMTVGAFAVLSYIGSPSTPVDDIEDLSGLSQTNPYAAASMGVFLLSMIGLPLTAGFAGKFLLFLSALSAPKDAPLNPMYEILALIAAVAAAVGAFYYLRVIGVMYLRNPNRKPMITGGLAASLAILICLIATIGFGVYPWALISQTRAAVGSP